MTNWKPYKLNELGFLGRGRSRHRPRNDPSLYGGKYPFVQTAEITASDLYINTYSQTYNEKGLGQSKFWETNTLGIVNAGVNTGDSALLKFTACFPDSVIVFIADEKKSDVRFIKYYLDWIKPQIRQITRGATQDNLSVSKLLSFNIVIPTVSEQRKIAKVLSNYDNLIENNTRRIQILEEMAGAVYREWFVHFRFPGYEQVKMVESELGMIPEKWKVVPLADYIEFVRGVEPGSINYLDKPSKKTVPFLRVGDLGSRPSNIYVQRKIINGRMVTKNDIVISMDGTVGIVRIGLEGGYSTGIRKIVFRGEKNLGWGFTYLLLQSENIQETIKSHARGTTILHASSSIPHLKFSKPDKSIMEEFEVLSESMLQMILILQEKNEKLRFARDLLLPRLISGALDISEIEIEA